MTVRLVPEDFTIGVEEEYQLTDADTGALRSRAQSVLATDWSGEIKREMLANSVEVGTDVCRSAEELRIELGRLRLQASIAAEAGGLRVVATGTHPYTPPGNEEFTPGPVYERLRAEYRNLAVQQSIFGLHIHVSVPPALDRARLINATRHFLPYMLAMSASSPLHIGEDTGYASYRSILWRRWPRSGPPPRFENDAEYQRTVGDLVNTGWIDAPGRIYWEIRAHHAYPTLEFRVADVTPRLEDAVLIATLTRALVAGAAAGIVSEPSLSSAAQQVILVENGWKASRDGLAAKLLSVVDGRVVLRPVRELIEELFSSLTPVAEELGDLEVFQQVGDLLSRGEGAARIRERVRDLQNDPREVMRWLADETLLGVGMDKRAEQRE